MPANANFDDIVTTTLRNRSGKLADNATRTTALLDRLRRRGKVRPAAGGRTIVQELEVGLNDQGGWFAGYDTLNTVPYEPFTAAEYDWKQAYVPVVWSGLEKLKNMGEHEVIDLVAGRIKNGEKALYDLVAQAAYSAGTSYGGKQMHGLGLMVTASANNTVGGISQSTYSFWANQTGTVDYDASTNIATTNPSPYITALNSIAIACTRGTDRPDLYVADAVGYRKYLEALQPNQRITDETMAGAGFTSLKYYGVGSSADFVLDNGYCPSKTTYALNTNFIYLRPHPDRNFMPFGGDRIPVNQDATVRFLGFAGNMTASNLARQGIITDV